LPKIQLVLCWLAMHDEQTTAAIQRYIDALPEDTDAELAVRELLERAVCRLRLLCGALLHRSYPRLTHPPLNLETDEMLGGVVAGLLQAMRTVRPQTVRQFFALATQHMRWQLNDLARRLDQQSVPLRLSQGGAVVPAPPPSSGSITPEARRIWAAIEGLPEPEREVFDLVRVQGLTHPETAGLIGTSVKTVQRRLNRARVLLAEELSDLRPAESGAGQASPDESEDC
jgi:RNA polymerase sigma factor (sigma-70 family)